jgi:PKD repeat protein
MRKLYFPLILMLAISIKTKAQDVANFTFKIQSGNYVSFTNTSAVTQRENLKAVWTFGDGKMEITTPLANIQHHYTRPGPYAVCLKIYRLVSNGTTTDTVIAASVCKSIFIETNRTDSCNIKFETGTTDRPLKKLFVAQPWNSNGKKPERICWIFGDGKDTCITYDTTRSSNYAIYHEYARGGNYNVCVKIKYAGGCEADKCKTITVNDPVVPRDTCRVELNELVTGNSLFVRHLAAKPWANRKAEKIWWSFGDGKDTSIIITDPANPGSFIAEHRYPAPGTYKACVKILYSGGCIATSCREVVIRASSGICGGYLLDSLTNSNTVSLKGFGIHPANDKVIAYRWTFGDGTAATGQNVTHTYSRGGHYEICLMIKTDKGCETKICKKIEIRGNTESNLRLAPNPVINTLHAIFKSIKQEEAHISIFNSTGLMVKTYTRKANAGTNNWEFEVGSLPTGIYSVIVNSPNQQANGIFFKQ